MSTEPRPPEPGAPRTVRCGLWRRSLAWTPRDQAGNLSGMTVVDDRPEDPEAPRDLGAPDPGLAAVRFGTVFRWAVAAGLGLLTVGGAAFAVYTVRGVLVQVVIAAFIAVSLDPAV